MDRNYYFSAPGRTEIGGNHTDHQNGCVLAAAVNLKTTACVTLNGENVIRINSEGFAPTRIELADLSVREEERNTTAALVRGVTAGFLKYGGQISGFDADVSSAVLPGSGLSSSAAFEVLIGRILNSLFFENRVSDIEIARIGQYAERVYFGKPCGLMDQMVSSIGGLVYIDFSNSKMPVVEKINFDFSRCGYSLCIIDCGADHANLTEEYAAIPQEMKRVAKVLGKEVLGDVEEAEFYASLPKVREAAGDRAALRALHFFEENRRVQLQVQALKNNEFSTFLDYVNQSGISSWLYLQNIVPSGSSFHQQMAFTLALCKKWLNGRGAVRVHGGGFAGTAQAFVPNEELDRFVCNVSAYLGENRCHVLQIQG